MGTEANDLVNCVAEGGHSWKIKHSIVKYLLSDARLLHLYVNSLSSHFCLSWIRSDACI